jgi:hypothetical protein
MTTKWKVKQTRFINYVLYELLISIAHEVLSLTQEFLHVQTANSQKYKHVMQLNSAVKLRVQQIHNTRKVI